MTKIFKKGENNIGLAGWSQTKGYLQWWFFGASGLAALLIAWGTVVIEKMKAAGVNPSKCLSE